MVWIQFQKIGWIRGCLFVDHTVHTTLYGLYSWGTFVFLEALKHTSHVPDRFTVKLLLQSQVIAILVVLAGNAPIKLEDLSGSMEQKSLNLYKLIIFHQFIPYEVVQWALFL